MRTSCSTLQPTPAPLPIKGLWGCCTLVLQQLLQLLCNGTSADLTAPALQLTSPQRHFSCPHMSLLLQLSWCCCTEPTPAPLPIEGL